MVTGGRRVAGGRAAGGWQAGGRRMINDSGVTVYPDMGRRQADQGLVWIRLSIIFTDPFPVTASPDLWRHKCGVNQWRRCPCPSTVLQDAPSVARLPVTGPWGHLSAVSMRLRCPCRAECVKCGALCRLFEAK